MNTFRDKIDANHGYLPFVSGIQSWEHIRKPFATKILVSFGMKLGPLRSGTKTVAMELDIASFLRLKRGFDACWMIIGSRVLFSFFLFWLGEMDANGAISNSIHRKKKSFLEHWSFIGTV